MNHSGSSYISSYSDTNIQPGGERTGIQINSEIVSGLGGCDSCHKHVALQLKAISSDTSLPTVAVRLS